MAVPNAGVAASLGYEDGQTPAEEMSAVSRIVKCGTRPGERLAQAVEHAAVLGRGQAA
ncbi:hypothetical protein ACWDAO_09975 [Streptomyces sp. NPDC001212]